jgi:hypothetical protein
LASKAAIRPSKSSICFCHRQILPRPGKLLQLPLDLIALLHGRRLARGRLRAGQAGGQQQDKRQQSAAAGAAHPQ